MSQIESESVRAVDFSSKSNISEQAIKMSVQCLELCVHKDISRYGAVKRECRVTVGESESSSVVRALKHANQGAIHCTLHSF